MFLKVYNKKLKNLTKDGKDYYVNVTIIPLLDDDGKIYERLAQLYLDVDKFDACVTASENALDKGGLRSSQQVYIVKGMCQFNKDQSVVANLNRARQSFVSCRNEARRKEDDSNQRVCQQWITYIDRETARLEQLEAAI